MAFADITVEAVHSTLDEFDKLGRDAFLTRYGFGPAKSYFLVFDGNSYDSKAIVAALMATHDPTLALWGTMTLAVERQRSPRCFVILDSKWGPPR